MIGQTISHYRIVEKLGEGGMGEVYRAEDTSLGRTVALKFLPAAFREDPIAHKRFLREARSAAVLDHPYICNIFEVAETDDGANFIVMEYLEGETLQTRLQEGPCSLRESLKLGAELAEALESAHSKGIVHRDLKPANIMITPSGHTKIMDFGLAKKLVAEDGREQDISSALTREGATLGTLSYMSPEQLKGRPVDHRSDIFSLGIVLYEMLSGVHPFRKSQAAETTGAILRDDPPPLTRYVEGLPEVLRHTVEKMLAKDPAERYQSVHEVLTNLNQLREDSGKIRTAQEPGERTTAGWVWKASTLALVVLVGLIGVWELWVEQKVETTHAPLIRFAILLPEGERLASGSTFRQAVAISPDGLWVAYASYKPGEGDEPDGDPVISLRRLDRSEARRIPGFNPFFSPDSKQLGFVEFDLPEGYLLRRTALDGGPIEPVAGLEMAPFGCAWLPDDTIIFSPGIQTGLFAVPAVGGEPRPLTQLGQEASEVSHRLPFALPDGHTILYTALRFSDHDWSRARIVAERLDTGEKKVLIEGGSDGRYTASGHLLFAREGRLMAIRLDTDRLEIRGEAVPVLDGVVHTINTLGSREESGAAQFVVSRSGLLTYAPGAVSPEPLIKLLWVDRRGREETIELPDRGWTSPRISLDGREILLTTGYPPRELWIYGLDRKTLRRQTVDGSAYRGIWGPEEGSLTLNWDPEGPEGLWVKQIDSGSERGEELVLSGSEGIPSVGSWSLDGSTLAFSMWVTPEPGGLDDTDIWILVRQGRAEPWLQTRFHEYQPEFSPDGRWLAYTSHESGRGEVYVRPFPGPGSPFQVSTEGGREPCWSKDGKEIFYLQRSSSETTFYAVKFQVNRKEGEVRLGAPRRLFSGPFSGGGFPSRNNYDVGPDGRFLVRKRDQKEFRLRRLEAMAPTRIELVQNWFEELEEKVPTELSQ